MNENDYAEHENSKNFAEPTKTIEQLNEENTNLMSQLTRMQTITQLQSEPLYRQALLEALYQIAAQQEQLKEAISEASGLIKKEIHNFIKVYAAAHEIPLE